MYDKVEAKANRPESNPLEMNNVNCIAAKTVDVVRQFLDGPLRQENNPTVAQLKLSPETDAKTMWRHAII